MSDQISRGPFSSEILGDDEVHLLDYVKVLYKRRWTALTAFLIVVSSVSLYTFTATPIYEARVQILIEKENSNVVTFKEAFEQNQVTDDYYQTQYKIVQSRALARRTIAGWRSRWLKKQPRCRDWLRNATTPDFGTGPGDASAPTPSRAPTPGGSIPVVAEAVVNYRMPCGQPRLLVARSRTRARRRVQPRRDR